MHGGAPIPFMQCPVAGFQFHGGEGCWARIRPGDRLTLRREPTNRHDPRAIAVAWQEVQLGYVPREANYALAQMLDEGVSVEARVKSLQESPDPWRRVTIEVALVAAPALVPPAPPPSAAEEIILVPERALPVPPAPLAPGCGVSVAAALRALAPLMLREAVGEVARQLSLPLRGLRTEVGRSIVLWESLEITIGREGRGLGARRLDPSAPALTYDITLDLKRPLAPGAWIGCFRPVVAAACARHGGDGSPELEHWILVSLRLALEGLVDPEALRKPALAFLAPEPLARSLTNRIFGPGAPAAGFNWTCEHTPAIALIGVEQPAMLPFLRVVQDDRRFRVAADPLAALEACLAEAGIEPAAWKALPRWGFATIEALGEAWWKPIPLARMANLLLHLEVASPPPPAFAPLALQAAYFRQPQGARLDLERHPRWFMRALLRAAEAAKNHAQRVQLRREMVSALEWLLEAGPQPDPNQQHAGWPWIVEQAAAHALVRMLADSKPWPVPLRQVTWPPRYRVVAIRSAAELVAEAEAMKNCLADYEDACRAGEVLVFSVRDDLTDERLACFAATRYDDEAWELIEVAGRMNEAVGEEIARVAEATVGKLNGTRPHPPPRKP